jgi:hypothetical protein
MLKKYLVILGTALVMTQPAQAAVVVKNIGFTTTNFVDIVGSASPTVAAVTGSFTVTFDTALNYSSNTTDIVVHNFSGPTVSSALGFSYDAASKFFWFGGIENGANLVYSGTNDYILTLDLSNINAPRAVTCGDPGIVCAGQTGNSNYLASGYAVAGSGSLFLQDARVTTIAPVPEPTTWALFIAGFGVIGGAMRSRRKLAKARFAF